MNRKELAEIIAKDAGCSKKVANVVLGNLFDAIVDDVAKGGETSIIGFGTFKAVKRAARTTRNPRTGEQIKVPARKIPTFKAGTKFKEACLKK